MDFSKSLQKDCSPANTLVLAYCYGMNFYVPPNSYVEILMPNVMVLGNGPFGRWLGHGDEALMNGISALMKETPQSSLDPLPCEDTMRSLQPKREVCTLGPPCLQPDLGLSVSRTMRNKFLLFIRKSVCGICYSSPSGLKDQVWL